MRRIATGVGLVGVKNPKGDLAADIATAFALGATVLAHSSAARWRMYLVNCFTCRISEDERWHAPVALFREGADFFASGGKGGGLVAAALAGTDTAGAWAIDREQLGPGVSVGDLREAEAARIFLC